MLAPSDVLAGRGAPAPLPGRVRVGGRVTSVDGSTIVLTDALGAIDVLLRSRSDLSAAGGPGPDAAIGELLVVDGTPTEGALLDAIVVERSPGRAPAAGTESRRFTVEHVGRHLELRARALRAVRAHFEAEGFIEVETPVRVESPGLDAHVDAIAASGEWLITSPELHMKRLLVGGLPRVYQLARVSRAGELGHLHQPEFTMVEWYRAFSGMEAMIADTESLVSAVAVALRGSPVVTTPDGRDVDVTPPYPRVTVQSAFREHAAVDDAAALARDDADRYFQLFVDHVEPALARRAAPVMLCEFPATEAALARPCPHDPSVAERFELYVGGVELCNGFGELTDPTEQRRRFVLEQARRVRASAPQHPIDERFLAALEEGLPPSGGNALGFDRLVALCLGAGSIASVVAFPRDRE